ncbi:MAG: methyltransferase domain-containing protein [Gemmataceae bacterium]|nr:methyltransferase domain-containing protein [Gemmataceae bacterium]MDW8264209.1 methyltransferase domain-containing protein [Gemmataceae bacterium]
MIEHHPTANASLTIHDIQRDIRTRVPLGYAPLHFDTLYRHESELSYRQDVLELAVLPAGPSWLGRLKTWAKRVLRLGLRWVLMRQVEFNGVVVEQVRETAQLLSQLDQNLGELYDTVRRLERAVEAFADQQGRAESELGRLRREVSRVRDTLVSYRVRVKLHGGLGPEAEAGAPSPNGTHELPFDYFLFENQFRGTREEIRDRQRVYLPWFRDRGKVLDIGCGRGEFVELLASEGIPVQGIDSNAEMVAFCRELGLAVVQAEGEAYLTGVEEQSLGGIFLGQVVEHLPPAGIARLLERCWRALRKGGVLVVETVNPCCPEANGNFYLDPTHVRPVHPELLRFLMESQGFAVEEAVYSAPVDPGLEPVVRTTVDAGAPLHRYQDYALVGRK